MQKFPEGCLSCLGGKNSKVHSNPSTLIITSTCKNRESFLSIKLNFLISETLPPPPFAIQSNAKVIAQLRYPTESVPQVKLFMNYADEPKLRDITARTKDFAIKLVINFVDPSDRNRLVRHFTSPLPFGARRLCVYSSDQRCRRPATLLPRESMPRGERPSSNYVWCLEAAGCPAVIACRCWLRGQHISRWKGKQRSWRCNFADGSPPNGGWSKFRYWGAFV